MHFFYITNYDGHNGCMENLEIWKERFLGQSVLSFSCSSGDILAFFRAYKMDFSAFLIIFWDKGLTSSSKNVRMCIKLYMCW